MNKYYWIDMNCEEIKIILPEYIDGILDEPTVELVSTHLEGCSSCREYHGEMSSFLAFADSMPEILPPLGMKEEFMAMAEAQMQPKVRSIILVPAWLKVAAILVLVMITFSVGYYTGGEQKRQRLEVALNESRQQVLVAGLQELTGPQKIQAVYSISQSGQSGDDLIDALVTTMNSDRNVNVRLAAINALNGMMDKNPRVKKELIRSLSLQENSLLQISLIQVLSEAGVKEAKPEIESIASKEETDEKVKAFAKDMIKIII